MAKRRKPYHVETYHECMSGKDGEIHKQRVIRKAELCAKQGKRVCNIKLTPTDSGLSLSRAAKICKR